jgi:hypothetical protein
MGHQHRFLIHPGLSSHHQAFQIQHDASELATRAEPGGQLCHGAAGTIIAISSKVPDTGTHKTVLTREHTRNVRNVGISLLPTFTELSKVPGQGGLVSALQWPPRAAGAEAGPAPVQPALDYKEVPP